MCVPHYHRSLVSVGLCLVGFAIEEYPPPLHCNRLLDTRQRKTAKVSTSESTHTYTHPEHCGLLCVVWGTISIGKREKDEDDNVCADDTCVVFDVGTARKQTSGNREGWITPNKVVIVALSQTHQYPTLIIIFHT